MGLKDASLAIDAKADVLDKLAKSWATAFDRCRIARGKGKPGPVPTKDNKPSRKSWQDRIEPVPPSEGALIR
jgi:hypothetical protein